MSKVVSVSNGRKRVSLEIRAFTHNFPKTARAVIECSRKKEKIDLGLKYYDFNKSLSVLQHVCYYDCCFSLT